MPEGDLAVGEEGVFAGVPAEEVGSFGVGGVVRAGSPDFVEEKEARLIQRVMKIVLEAAFFLARRSDEGADFGFQQELLTLFGAEDYDEGDRIFGKFGGFKFVDGFLAGLARGGFFRFSFGHDGGDCIAVSGGGGKEYSQDHAGGRTEVGSNSARQSPPFAKAAKGGAPSSSFGECRELKS